MRVMTILERPKSDTSPLTYPKVKKLRMTEGKNLYTIFAHNKIRKILHEYLFIIKEHSLEIMNNINMVNKNDLSVKGITIKAYEIRKDGRRKIPNTDILRATGMI